MWLATHPSCRRCQTHVLCTNPGCVVRLRTLFWAVVEPPHPNTRQYHVGVLQILEQDPPSSCDFFVNCFDVHRSAGLRGFYLGFQGAVLGVWLDQVQFRLMKKFTTMLTVLMASKVAQTGMSHAALVFTACRTLSTGRQKHSTTTV